jgi:[ribosomal protein S18]-alanine N-acetyltransferase
MFVDRMPKFARREPPEPKLPIATRLFESRDLEAVAEVQSESPETAPWSLRDYERVARGEMPGWVAEMKEAVIGFVVARRVVSDAEILNLAVRRSHRRQGVGSALLAAVFQWTQSFRAQKVLLEVRASNSGALKFYEQFNFQIVGSRPHYYTAPKDDALLLTCIFSKPD